MIKAQLILQYQYRQMIVELKVTKREEKTITNIYFSMGIRPSKLTKTSATKSSLNINTSTNFIPQFSQSRIVENIYSYKQRSWLYQ
jgi:hypothetical protein